VLAALPKTSMFVRKDLLHETVGAYVKVMQGIQDAVSSPQSTEEKVILEFKKFFLLGALLHTEKGKHAREIVRSRIDKILRNEWDDFTLANLGMRSGFHRVVASNLDEETQLKQEFREKELHHRKVFNLLKAHEVGAATRRLLSQLKPAVIGQDTIDTLAQMISSNSNGAQAPQHTETAAAATVDEVVAEDTHDSWTPITNLEAASFVCTAESVYKILRSTSRAVSPGLDGLRYNFLRQMSHDSRNVDEGRHTFLHLLTRLVNYYLTGKLPKVINAFLAEAEVFPLAKKTGGIRPIMMVNSFRKLAALAVVEQFDNQTNLAIFKQLQFGINRKFGMETIVHTMAALLKDRPHLDFVFADFQNAFNVVSREQVLKAVRAKFPLFERFFEACYDQDSSAWVFSNEGVYQLISSMGVHQGDPLGCIAFALAVQDLFEKVEALARRSDVESNEGAVKAYIDDLSMCASFDNMSAIIKLLQTEGEEIGVRFNLLKTVIMIGECATREEALGRKLAYESMGFAASNVMLHPANRQLDEDEATLRQRFGTVCLGVPVGDELFVKEWLATKLESFRSEGESLLDFKGSTQGKMLMLRYSFAQKVTHLLRCIPPVLIKDFASKFDALKIDLFLRILGLGDTDIPSSMQKQQILTHIRDGGFGLGNAVDTSPSAYVASVAAALEVVESAFPRYPDRLQFQWIHSQRGVSEEALFVEWSKLEHIIDLRSEASWLSHLVEAVFLLRQQSSKAPNLERLFDREESAGFGKLQKDLFKPFRAQHKAHMLKDWLTNSDLQRYKSCVGNGEDASAWLEAFPSPEFELSNEAYRIACILRLGVAFPEIIRTARERGDRNHHKCYPCSKNSKTDSCSFDDRGHHFAHGCKCGGGRTQTHNAIRDSVFYMLRELGKFAEREVTLIPLSTVSENGHDGANQSVTDVVENVDDGEDEEDMNVSVLTSVSAASGKQPRPLRADVVIHDSELTIIEISVTNPCLGVPVAQSSAESTTSSNTAELRSNQKRRKYRTHRIIDFTQRRKFIPFSIEFFGRLDPVAFAYFKDLSREVLGKGYVGAQFRTYWFQRISCSLQRLHATSFQRNLSIARDEAKPSAHTVSYMDYEGIGYVNARSSSGVTRSRAG